MKPVLLLLLPLSLAALTDLPAADRVVSAGGAITEIIAALGCEDRLVGVDSSSTHPETVTALPGIGYARALSAEGILSLQPDLLVGYEECGPPGVLSHLERAGVEVLLLPSEPTVDNTEHRIRRIADTLGVPERAEPLIDQIRAELHAALPEAPAPPAPRVLFLYARSGGVLNASGTATNADAMIRLAGGSNAITGYEGYKPLTAEAALLAAPEIILVTTGGLADAGGIDALLQHPGLIRTPAAKQRRVVVMDDLLLLGFGPRIGAAVAELSRQLQAPAPLRAATDSAAR